MPAELDLAAARRLAPTLAEVGRALGRAGLSERSVCAWLGCGLVSDARWVTPPDGKLRRGLGGWIALLVAGEAVPRAQLGILDGAQLAALIAIGIVELDGDVVRACASLVPVRGALVLADRLDDHSRGAVGSPDVSAWNLVASLPARARSLLDVGCGAGTASLVAARAGCQVIGTDVDGRALAFAAVNAMLNDVSAVFLEGDLYAGLDARCEVVAFNAPLVRAPLVGEAPLYLRAPDGDTLAVRFLDGARAHATEGAEVLCHVQLVPEVVAAAARAGFSRVVELHFADAVDGTPHGLIALDDGARTAPFRARVPLGPALPHLARELVDRLRATAELVLASDETLRAAIVRPPPWLELVRRATHDGAAFRERAVRFGAHRLDAEDLALLESATGRPLGELAPDEESLHRARSLVERGLLVV